MSVRTKKHRTKTQESLFFGFKNQSYYIHDLTVEEAKKIKDKINKLLQQIPEENVEVKEGVVSWKEAYKDEFLTYPGIDEYKEAAMTLKGARLSLSLTQIELAKKMGVEQGYISRLENAKIPIGKRMAQKLGKALNKSAKIFLT